jgi:hypothetical protein
MSEENLVTEQTIILRHIRDNKKALLSKAFTFHIGSVKMVDIFRKCYEISEHRKAKDILNWVCIELSEAVEKSGQGIASSIDKKYFTQEGYCDFITKRQVIANNMRQVSYIPPSDNDELTMHLWSIYCLYENIPISWPPTVEDICLDFSFAKLLSKAHLKIGAEYTRIERKEISSRGNTEIKRQKAELWKSFVLGIYEHGEPIAPGTNLSETFEIIRRQFEESKESALKKSGKSNPKWGVIPDSVKAGKKKRDMKMGKRDILRTLFETEGILERDFEKPGNYWIKKM